MTQLAWELAAMAVYGPLIVLLHELGHAMFARLGGYRVTSFGIGLGPPLWRLQLRGGVVLHIDRGLLAGGACTAIPIGPPTTRRVWFHAGGLFVQALLMGVLLLLPDSWLVQRVLQFNLLVATVNTVPWRWGGAASDGWHIWDAVRGGRRTGDVLPPRPALQRLAHREAQIGSPVGRMYADLCLAWGSVLVNRLDEARPFFESDPPETAIEPWLDALYQYVLAEWHRLAGRPLAALRTVRTTHTAIGDDLVDEAAALIAIAEARALVDLDSPAPAARALARASGLSGPIGRQATVVHLRAVLGEGEGDLEYATWRVARRVHQSWLDPADVVMALWEAADQLQEDGRAQAAQGAREAAAQLARRTLNAASPADRGPLRERLGAVVAIGYPGGRPAAGR